jgi:hypothetical protein
MKLYQKPFFRGRGRTELPQITDKLYPMKLYQKYNSPLQQLQKLNIIQNNP